MCWMTGLCCKSLSHRDFCRETFDLDFDRNRSSTAFLMNDGFLDSFFLVLGENVSSRSTLEFMASALRNPQPTLVTQLVYKDISDKTI